MYDSSLIGQQWAASIAAIDKKIKEETDKYGLDYMLEIDDLLEQRKRLVTALYESGELTTTHTEDTGIFLHDKDWRGYKIHDDDS